MQEEMASVKLWLPPPAALLQYSSNLSFSTLSDRIHHPALPPGSPLRLRSSLSVTHDSTSARSSSASSRRDSNGNDDDEVNEDRKRGHFSSTGQEESVERALSEYILSEPSKTLQRASMEERDAIVNSVIATKSSLLDALDRVRYKLYPSDFTTILKRFIQQRHWDKVGLVFDWMKANKKLKPQTLSTYMVLMGKSRMHDRALLSYRGLTDLDLKLNKFVCNTLLKILVDAATVDKAFKLFEEMKDNGFVPDVFTYSIIISGCAKRKDAYIQAKKYVSEMLSRGLKPDSFVYASVLHVYASSGMEEEAMSLFREMQDDGIKPVKFHYAPLLNMYAVKQKQEEAEMLFDEFKKSGLPVDEVILNCLMKVYANSGNLEEAHRIFMEMPSLCCPPGEVTYSVLIDSFCKGGRLEDAKMLLEEMKTKGINPGNHAYSMIISAYSKLGEKKMVESLSNEAIVQMRGSSDAALFNSILKSYCALGMREAVMNTLKRMKTESITPDRATFNILILYFCRERLFDIALQAFSDLKFRKFRPNFNSYAPLIIGLAEARRIDQALDLYTEMKKAAIRPSIQICAALVDVLSKERRVDEVLKFLKEMVYQGLLSSTSSIESILLTCGSHIEILDQILDDIIGQRSAVLNEVNWVAILAAYQKQGLYVAMRKLIDFIKVNEINVGDVENLNELITVLQKIGQTEIIREITCPADIQIAAISAAS